MAGPNGSGKSTILQAVRNQFYSGPFVNADEIEKSFRESSLVNLPANYNLTVTDELFDLYMHDFGRSWQEKAARENSPVTIQLRNGMLMVDGQPSGYDAAIAADFIRNCLLQQGATFTFETVLSHSSKVIFLQQCAQAGYKNYLYFICTVDPAINIERVKQRVLRGGHDVEEARILKRYYESLDLLSAILPTCYRSFLFDNSTEERSVEPVARIAPSGEMEILTSELPWWVEEYVIGRLYRN